MYEKTILLTRDKRLEQSIKLLLTTKKKSVVNEFPLLSDLTAIHRDIGQFQNTLHLRGEFGSFVKNHGFPFMIIMDYIIDFGLPKQVDPDMRKLFRTFLIAFTILTTGKGYNGAKVNIVLIIDRRIKDGVTALERDPSIFLDRLETQDSRVNAIIGSFSNDQERVKDLYNIRHICRPQEGDYKREIDSLDHIIDETDGLLRDKERDKRMSGVTGMITDDLEPATVICRSSQDRIIVNGEQREISEDERKRYQVKNINLIGAITSKTVTTVCDRILDTFTAIRRINPFKKDEKIFINIPDTSTLDGSFAPSMGSFFNGELGAYSGISINIGTANCSKVRQSQGFIAIKDFLIKNL
jgi:hypothetical protein